MSTHLWERNGPAPLFCKESMDELPKRLREAGYFCFNYTKTCIFVTSSGQYGHALVFEGKLSYSDHPEGSVEYQFRAWPPDVIVGEALRHSGVSYCLPVDLRLVFIGHVEEVVAFMYGRYGKESIGQFEERVA